MKPDPWNRCDVCGRFIAIDDFGWLAPSATRTLITPDSDRSREEWETLCKEHSGLKARLEA
jgi:hypothetical protein